MTSFNTGESGKPASFEVFDLEALEEQVARLWTPEFAGTGAISTLPTRTNVLNLIIYASDKSTQETASRAVERLSGVLPSRVILFNVSQVGDGSVPSAEIFRPAESDQNPLAPCVERICIPVQPDTLRQIPSLIAPFVIPELPTFLWWPGSPPLASPEIRQIATSADHLILDSFGFEATRLLTDVVRMIPAVSDRTTLSDLNWARLQPWRELTAQFFDIENVRWSLERVREVEIEFGQLPDNELPTQALMFAHWLAHCLGWTLFDARRTRRDRWYFGMTDQLHDPIRIILRARPVGSDYQGHLLSLGIIARNKDQQSSSLSLTRTRGSAIIRMHAKSGFDTELHHATHQPLLSEEALLLPLLEISERDSIYEETLARCQQAISRLEGSAPG